MPSRGSVFRRPWIARRQLAVRRARKGLGSSPPPPPAAVPPPPPAVPPLSPPVVPDALDLSVENGTRRYRLRRRFLPSGPGSSPSGTAPSSFSSSLGASSSSSSAEAPEHNEGDTNEGDTNEGDTNEGDMNEGERDGCSERIADAKGGAEAVDRWRGAQHVPASSSSSLVSFSPRSTSEWLSADAIAPAAGSSVSTTHRPRSAHPRSPRTRRARRDSTTAATRRAASLPPRVVRCFWRSAASATAFAIAVDDREIFSARCRARFARRAADLSAARRAAEPDD